MAGEVAVYPIVYHYGDTFDGLSVQWKDSAGVANDLTGFVASMKVKNEDGTALLSLSSPSIGMTIPTPANGTVVINAVPSLMIGSDLVEGETYEYDLQVKNAAGTVIKTLIKGPFRVDKQVTD